ncbi:MAG: hypothetical protein K0Q85_188 [Caproiciproducens sp.]|nr:hypothetical protein [Caproiciproducens sp.]
MLHHKTIKSILMILFLFLLTVTIVGCSFKPQSAPVANSAPNGGGVAIRAMVVKLTQSEYASVVKTGLENPSIDDFKTLMIGVSIIGIDPAKDKTILCPDIGEITQKLSSKIVWSANSDSMDNGAGSVVNYDNTLVLHTKDISNDALKLKLKGLKIAVAYMDLNGKKIEKSFDIADILQFV